MLLERGSEEIIALDIKEKTVHIDKRITYVKHDITQSDYSSLISKFKGVDVVYHVAALVGPYHSHELYYKVNVEGTQNMVSLCKKSKCYKIRLCREPKYPLWWHELYG